MPALLRIQKLQEAFVRSEQEEAYLQDVLNRKAELRREREREELMESFQRSYKQNLNNIAFTRNKISNEVYDLRIEEVRRSVQHVKMKGPLIE